MIDDIQSVPSVLRPTLLFGLVLTLSTVVGSGAAAAAEREWGLAAGWYDAGRSHEAAEASFDVLLRKEFVYGLRWQLGGLVTSDGSVMGFVGFRRPVSLGASWVLDLATSVGLFEDGGGKELGGTVEFRSGLSVERRLASGTRVGLGFAHISNSGIYDLNPGSNTLFLRYVFGPRRRGK